MKNLIDSLINISKRDYKFHWWNSSREIIMYYVLSQPVKKFHQQGMYSREQVIELLHKFRKETYNGYSASKWIKENIMFRKSESWNDRRPASTETGL